MAKKTKNYVRDKQPKTLWSKIGPFVKLREYLASNITPDVYANERGLKTKIMEFFGQDVPKANVDDFSQNLWFRFLNQPNNLKEENGIVRIPDNIKSIISDRINGGWEKMTKKYGRELDSLDNKIIDGKVAGKDVSDYGGFKGLFQESDKRYPPKEFEKDKERFKGDKRGYINYMIDRFYDHVQDAGMYSIKDTKYNKAIHAVSEFMSEDPDTDYSYPLVYAFEAPSDKEGTYKNRKSVSNLISQSYVLDNVDKNDNTIVDAILGIKNDLELQDSISTTRGEAFKEARKRGLKEFTWNGKGYNTNIKKEGGVVGKQREAYEYFTNKRGMSKIQALAIIGNLMAESGLKDDIYGDNRTSYGIQQWHNERMDKLFKHAKKKGHSTPTFKDQLEFLADEYEGKTGYSNFLYTRKGKEGPGYYNYSRQDFMNADNLKDAVVAWNQGAGRPHKSVIRNDDRYNYAMEVAKNLGLEIEENSVSSYGQMGFGDDAEIAASVTLPEVEVAAALPNPEAPSQEGQSEEERFRTWTETYGKDIVNHLLTLDGKKDGDDSDYSMMYKQHEKESEEDKKMALINAVLPNIQLRIKGVTDN